MTGSHARRSAWRVQSAGPHGDGARVRLVTGGGDSPVTRPSQIGDLMSSRIFLSHSSKDNREAVALKQWLVDQDPHLAIR